MHSFGELWSILWKVAVGVFVYSTIILPIVDYFRRRQQAKERGRLEPWLKLLEPETRRIVEWWEDERREVCLGRLPSLDECNAGFVEATWLNIQSLEIEGHRATLWVSKPGGEFGATVDVLGCTMLGVEFPGGRVPPGRNHIKETPEEAIDDLRRRIQHPDYNY